MSPKRRQRLFLLRIIEGLMLNYTVFLAAEKQAFDLDVADYTCLVGI